MKTAVAAMKEESRFLSNIDLFIDEFNQSEMFALDMELEHQSFPYGVSQAGES